MQILYFHKNVFFSAKKYLLIHKSILRFDDNMCKNSKEYFFYLKKKRIFYLKKDIFEIFIFDTYNFSYIKSSISIKKDI